MANRTRPTRSLRLFVYQQSGFRCRGCGWAPAVPPGYDGRRALSEMWACHRTGRLRVRVLEIDHIVPHALGGKLRRDNCQALCSSCNARKGARV